MNMQQFFDAFAKEMGGPVDYAKFIFKPRVAAAICLYLKTGDDLVLRGFDPADVAQYLDIAKGV